MNAWAVWAGIACVLIGATILQSHFWPAVLLWFIGGCFIHAGLRP